MEMTQLKRIEQKQWSDIPAFSSNHQIVKEIWLTRIQFAFSNTLVFSKYSDTKHDVR